MREYERGVIFRLGPLVGKGPGLFFIIPVIDHMVKVDLRTVTLDVPPQEMITNDNVTVKVNAVAYFRRRPGEAIIQVGSTAAPPTRSRRPARSVIGEAELDGCLPTATASALSSAHY